MSLPNERINHRSLIERNAPLFWIKGARLYRTGISTRLFRRKTSCEPTPIEIVYKFHTPHKLCGGHFFHRQIRGDDVRDECTYICGSFDKLKLFVCIYNSNMTAFICNFFTHLLRKERSSSIAMDHSRRRSQCCMAKHALFYLRDLQPRRREEIIYLYIIHMCSQGQVSKYSGHCEMLSIVGFRTALQPNHADVLHIHAA